MNSPRSSALISLLFILIAGTMGLAKELHEPKVASVSGESLYAYANPSDPENWFTTGQSADLILGPLGFENSGGPSFLHHPGSVETDGTKLFAADTRNNRILIWNTIPITNYAPADVVVGQPDMYSSTTRSSQRGLAWPMSVATDGQRLFVADTNNNRVLIWNSIPTTNYQPADIVLGQPDFNSWDESKPSPSSILWPWGVETDGQKLFVADTGHSRVLIWNSIPTQNNQPADVVIGIPNLWARSEWENTRAWMEANPRATLIGEGGPRGVCTDGTRLAVSTYEGPFKIWNSIPTQNGQPADVVFEEYKGEIEPDTDGARLFIVSEQAVLIWNSWPTLDNQPPDVVVGDRWSPSLTRDRMAGPRSVATDGTRLIVAETFGNSRVTIWNQIPTENGPAPADIVLGQIDFTSNVFVSQVGVKTIDAISLDGTRLFIYSGDERVVIHNALPEENNRPADVVLGQPDFTTKLMGPIEIEYRENLGDEEFFRRTFSYGHVFSDGVRLFVSDSARNRVLIWNSIPTSNFAPPDAVLGQPRFQEHNPPSAGRNGLNGPWGITSDGKRLIVVDGGNNRVLIWNTIPTENNQPADVVVGQPDFTSTEPGDGRTGFGEPEFVETDGKRLYVTDSLHRRVLVWNNIPTQNGQPADLVLGQPSFEVPGEGTSPELGPAVDMWPTGIATDGTHLFIVDVDHHRVLAWKSIPTENGQPADIVLGQPDFESPRRPSINRDYLFMPLRIAFDGQHLWVSEKKFSDRVVRFSIPNPTAVITKVPTDIGANSITLVWSQNTLEDFTRYEVHMSTEPGFTPSAETLLTTITNATITSYTIDNLPSSTTYYFKIRTYTSAGSYGDSVQRYATTLGAPPEEIMPKEEGNWLLYVGVGAVIAVLAVATALMKRRLK